MSIQFQTQQVSGKLVLLLLHWYVHGTRMSSRSIYIYPPNNNFSAKFTIDFKTFFAKFREKKRTISLKKYQWNLSVAFEQKKRRIAIVIRNNFRTSLAPNLDTRTESCSLLRLEKSSASILHHERSSQFGINRKHILPAAEFRKAKRR